MNQRLRLGIMAWLVLLSLFSVVPVALFSAFTIYRLGMSQQAALTQDVMHRSLSVADTIEQRLGAMVAALNALAQSDAALQGDVAALYRHAQRVLADMPDVKLIVLLDAAGRQVFNTAIPWGMATPTNAVPEVVTEVFRTKRAALSDLYVGTVIRHPTVSVNVPVIVDGRVTYCLRMAVLSDTFSQLLARQEIPEQWTAALVSQSGTIIARNRLAERFVGTRSAPSVLQAIVRRDEGIFDSVTHEGVAVRAAVAPIPSWNWAIAIGVPTDSLTSGLRRSLSAMAVGGVGLLAFGLVVAYWVSRHLARQVVGAKAASAALGSGSAPVLPPTHIRELDELGVALGSARTREEQVTTALSASKAMETKLARLVDELQQSGERYRLLFNGSNDAVLVHAADPTTGDPISCFTEVNDIACQRLGYSREELMRMGPDDLAGAHSIAGGSYRRRLAEEKTAVFQRIHVAKDGHLIPVEVNARLFELQGRTMVLSVTRDITERKLAEEALAKEAKRFQAILKTASDGIHVLDMKGRLIEASDSFLRMLGYSEAEAKHLNVADWDVQFAKPEILSKISGMMTEATTFETKHRRKDGIVFDVEISARGVELDGKRYLYNSSRDITSRKAAEAEIEQLAFYDTLTQLPNRRLLIERLGQAKALSHRTEDYGALIFIDLDNFKTLNDTLGHKVGDLLLGEVGTRLRSCVREADTVARLGGDEFVIMLGDLSPKIDEAATQAEAVGDKVLSLLGQPYVLAGRTHHSTASLGITLFRDKESSNDDLLKQADLAMYQAKAAGRNTKRFFDPEMQASLAARSALENDLRRATTEQELFLHYQPQVDRSGGLLGAECLVRWRHPQRGLVMPGEFIPLSEESDLILTIGHQVLEMACARLVAWSDDPATRGLNLAVNVSARQFRQPQFVDNVRSVVRRTGANPSLLKLELTESLVLQDVTDTIAKMQALKSDGISFSLDDFGTGYSSLAYLKLLPLSQIKIDRSFVRDILTDPNDAIIARTIIVLGKSLGLTVIAEGVEEPEQWNILCREGCDEAQGYLFGRPMPAEDFSALAKAQEALTDS